MSLNAARHARQVVRNVEQVLAMELICAAQAIWIQSGKSDAAGREPGVGVAAACRRMREAGIAPLLRDRVLQPDIRRAARLLRERGLVAAAREAASHYRRTSSHASA
jgi:histidine ammonia-lyase